jgi:vacuolar iron transporter family protein
MPMTAASDTDSTLPGHEHRDVSGGWLRPAVFGAMDGLVTNVSLIAGVGAGVGAATGGSASAPHLIILTGLAGLAAGAFSMATGEYVSVSSQNELVAAEVRKERHELEVHPDAERAELAAAFVQWGVEPELAAQAAKQVSAASLVTFAIGALVPLVPYLLGYDSLGAALGLAALAAFVGGGLVARLTDRPFLRGAVRQLLLGVLAAGITYLIGRLVGTIV